MHSKCLKQLRELFLRDGATAINIYEIENLSKLFLFFDGEIGVRLIWIV